MEYIFRIIMEKDGKLIMTFKLSGTKIMKIIIAFL